jgi:hypothetical protein
VPVHVPDLSTTKRASLDPSRSKVKKLSARLGDLRFVLFRFVLFL